MNNGIRLLATAACLSAAALIGWYIAPDYIARPYQEASQEDYSDAKSVFSYTEVHRLDSDHTYNTDIVGECPDLSVAVGKALLDQRLTVWEVHQLGEQARALYEEGHSIYIRNEALKAAGQPTIANQIKCDGGNTLFSR